MDLSVAKPSIMGLVAGRKKVLLRSGSGKKLGDNESISFNEDMKKDRSKSAWKIPVPRVVESGGRSRREESRAQVDEERRFVMDAAIVRIMKERRQLQHQALMAEVMGQIKMFHPDPRDIKMRIEDLISRDFLCRDGKDPQMFNYVA